MRVHRMQEGIARKTARASSGIKLSLRAIAIDDVVASITGIRRIGDAELRMVEDVERFGTNSISRRSLNGLKCLYIDMLKLIRDGLFREISARVAEGETSGRNESSRIEEKRSDIVSAWSNIRHADVRASDHIGVGTDTKPVSHTCVICCAGAIGTAAVDHTEGGFRSATL